MQPAILSVTGTLSGGKHFLRRIVEHEITDRQANDGGSNRTQAGPVSGKICPAPEDELGTGWLMERRGRRWEVVRKNLEVDAFQLQDRSLPEWQRKLGIVCLISVFVPKWEGPEPTGLHQIGAVSVHSGASMDDPGTTFWFYLPECPTDEVDPDRLADSASYIMQRLGRRSHAPTKVWKSVLFAAAPPGSN